MITPPHHARPFGLPLRLALGGAAMAALYLLLHGGSLADATKLLFGLNPPSDTPTITLLACVRTTSLISTALLLAFATSLTIYYLSHRLWPSAVSQLPLLGRFLFAAPAFGLVSAWAGWWIGSRGGVIETLMPPRPIGIGEEPIETLARHLWTWLAPTFALALPLTGCLLSQLSQPLNPSTHHGLTVGLRARGLTTTQILDHHLLPLDWSRWHRTLESSLFAALLLSIVIEYALDFPGWGSGFIRSLQNQNVQSTAFGLYTAGLILAILISILHLFRSRTLPSPNIPAPAKRSIPTVFAIVILILNAAYFLLINASSTLHLQTSQLITEQTWLSGWKNDARACLWIIELAFVGGIILAALRLTILGDWLRRYGSLETLVWSPLPIWALAWSHTSGHIISIDLALATLAAITLSIHLHTSTRGFATNPILDASRCLGASRLQAWRKHAMIPWLLELTAFLISLLGAAWWLRIASFSLLSPEKSDPLASIGSFLAHAATDAFHRPLPLLSASLAAAVSILSLWTLGRIIHPKHPDDA